jgi:hypothetical protein
LRFFTRYFIIKINNPALKSNHRFGGVLNPSARIKGDTMKLSIRVPLLIVAVVLVTSVAIVVSVDVLVARNMEKSAYTGIASNGGANAELLRARLDNLLNQL